MRLIFFGTPAVALPALDALIASRHEIAGVVTQPDRPKGRSGSPMPPPVAERAREAGLSLLQPATPKDEAFQEALAALRPDACAVVAYGHILPAAVLRVPPKGTYNAHFSLLPRYRGAAPVQRAIIAGDRVTGVSVFALEPTLDTGPILDRVEAPIEEDDTAGTLMERLAVTGAHAMVRVMDAVEAGKAEPVPQDDAAATPAPKIRPEESLIDWSRPAHEIRNLVRGLNPSPGAYAVFRGRRVKIWFADLVPGSGTPGEVLDPGEDFAIACGDGALRPIEMHFEGKRRMSPEEFARGARFVTGDFFASG